MKFITIGELLMRLSPPDYEKIRTTSSYVVNFGGADLSQRTTLTPDTWHTLEIEYDNSDVKNTSKVALYD